ncbi:hypothetical protein CR155_00830 [Pollutimonas nitritireducens]|uniref:RHS repeat-associated core domain-containing protein n=1 Tax=Pollutimonas nitritireducens TaxID=2045209 RepID=A0A2N4UKT7_9BURK|nr:DUF2235 domain-containing protein [Pollutimonas nitritireducens]PLC55633.1 hypothetical protein CR155_00830 [Pollutimonas nitritireducens]
MRRLSCCLLVLLALPGVPYTRAAGTCGPSLLGQPCATGGLAVASRPEPTLNLGAGNPIHIVTGNKYQQETDLPANLSTPGIEIVRHYNALDRRASTVGIGWQLSYDTRLAYAGDRWQIIQADGSRVDFFVTAGKPTANQYGKLESVGKDRVWTWPTGRQLWFNTSGHLVRLAAGRHLALNIERNVQPGPLEGTISKVSNQLGHSLSFSYHVSDGRAYLAHIDTALGRFRYQHEPSATGSSGLQRLTQLTRPDGMQRRYLYEPALQAGNVGAITGIETLSTDASQAIRSHSWGYDDRGRAVLSVHGAPSSQVDRINVRYVRQATTQQTGLTVVTNADQQETRFETAINGGRFVLTSVTGAGCTGCAPVGSTARYDQDGRLTTINGTRLARDAAGRILRLAPQRSGWPELALHYDSRGLRSAWHSNSTGTERILYNTDSLPAQRIWANADSVHYQYDALRRPIRLLETNKNGTLKTTLRWRADRLTHIRHPNETESRRYDRAGHLIHRKVERPSQSTMPLRYSESFNYDAQHRLTHHHLPEGGSLAYRWGADSRLLGITWHDAQGMAHTVIESKPGNAGYCHGNGLCVLSTNDSQGQASQLAVYQGDQALWSLAHAYDQQGRLRHEQYQTKVPGAHTMNWHYAYDKNSRLIGAQARPTSDPSPVSSGTRLWYAWNDDGSLAARRSHGVTHRPFIRRDASGLPVASGDTVLEYGPNRRLVAVHRPGKAPTHYQHNAFGHRIAQQSEHGTIHYLYLNNRLVAESRPGPVAENVKANTTLTITRRYIYAHHVPVGFIDYPDTSLGTGSAQLFAVHADFLGAPRLVTDARQAMRWLASYSPTGAATRLAGDLELDLRLPGQVFDRATGWHDNVMRTYAPEIGQYLEPDPLGPIPGNQAFGYADQQPRRYVDPLGLVLFAFDGTRNGPETLSNVWKLSQAYTDGPVYYHTGPGNSMYLDWDGVTGRDAPQIIENQWQSLLNTLERAGDRRQQVPIDIIGYSRGAALARHFGNLINQHTRDGLFSYRDGARRSVSACVDLRFMGLFDTVAQFGIAGSHDANYDLTIAPAWAWVAHAVALHERRWMYPLTIASDGGGYNLVEAPFIGAHADIGGGAMRRDDGRPSVRGDLADVTLNWMLWQARAASLRFGTLAEGDREISDPILHDGRSSIARTIQNGDRRIDQADGSLLLDYQDDHGQIGHTQRAATESMIARPENWRTLDTSEVGTVDMSGYAQWLHDELGWQAVPS